MKTKFRPGPWHISRYKEGRRLLIVDEEGFDIGAVDYPNRNETAALIAAAPDLYAALEELLYSRTDKAESMAQAALTKARGEQ